MKNNLKTLNIMNIMRSYEQKLKLKQQFDEDKTFLFHSLFPFFFWG